jgi:hypothetical protein
LIPSRRSCCQGPSSSWLQIRRKPQPHALVIDVWSPIAYQGVPGTVVWVSAGA